MKKLKVAEEVNTPNTSIDESTTKAISQHPNVASKSSPPPLPLHH